MFDSVENTFTEWSNSSNQNKENWRVVENKIGIVLKNKKAIIARTVRYHYKLELVKVLDERPYSFTNLERKKSFN